MLQTIALLPTTDHRSTVLVTQGLRGRRREREREREREGEGGGGGGGGGEETEEQRRVSERRRRGGKRRREGRRERGKQDREMVSISFIFHLHIVFPIHEQSHL